METSSQDHSPNSAEPYQAFVQAISQAAGNAGMNPEEQAIFTNTAFGAVQRLQAQNGAPITPQRVAEAIRDSLQREVTNSQHPQNTETSTSSPTTDHTRQIRDYRHVEDGLFESCQQTSITDSWAEDLALETFLCDFPKAPEVGIETVIDEHGASRKKFTFTQDGLEQFFGGQDPYQQAEAQQHTSRQNWTAVTPPNESSVSKQMSRLSIKYGAQDIITAMCEHIEIVVHLGVQLHPKSIVNLYAAHPTFRRAIDGNLLSTIRMWIAARSPEAGRVFPFQIYKSLLVPDPAGRRWAEQWRLEDSKVLHRNMYGIRTVPGLRYIQLVLGRDRYVRQILALMARSGHRMPPSMYGTLLRLWLLMDIPVTRQRMALLRNEELWTDVDLYNAQFFFIKLLLHFNDPIYGPNTHELLIVMLGQKGGLYPLWQLLFRKRWTRLPEVLELAVRYHFNDDDHHDEIASRMESGSIHGVPFDEVGTLHLEGWGAGHRHLMRPDELIPVEAVRRGLELDEHLVYMATWGFFDWNTKENLVPTEEEMFLPKEEEEELLRDMDTVTHWRRKHALKKRFDELTREQQEDIIAEDEDDNLRALAFGDCPDEWEDEEEDISSTSSDSGQRCLDDATPGASCAMYGKAEEEDESPTASSPGHGTTSAREFPASNADYPDLAPIYERHWNPDEQATADSDSDSDTYSLNDEIRRGFVLQPQNHSASQEHQQQQQPPGLDNHAGWVSFCNRAMMDLPPDISEDDSLQMQAWQTYSSAEMSFDWDRWLMHAPRPRQEG